MSRIVACITAALLCSLPASLQGQGADDRITLDQYLEWESVNRFFAGGPGPQVSPDGRQILYTRHRVDKLNDRWNMDLWIMNADGTRQRFLADGGGARWSPDGTRIAFVREGEPRGSQVFVRWMDDEGAVTQITHVDGGPGALAWSPDGEWIAFSMTVPHAEKWDVDLPARPEGATWTPEPKIVTRLNYRRDHVGYIDEGYRHLFVVPTSGGTPRQLTRGEWNHSGPEWTPDGRSLLFSSHRVPDAEHEWRQSDVYAVDIASGDIRRLTRRSGPDGNPVPSPDGRLIAYTGYDSTDDTYITSKLYVMAADGSNPREISGSLDRSPQSLTWAHDNSGVYFTANDRGTSNLHFAPVSGSGPRQVTQGNHSFQLASMTADGLAVGTLTGPTEPGDVVSVRVTDATAIRKLTDVNGDVLAGRKLGDTEEIWYTSTDGLRIQGWLIKPPDFDPSRRYPLMLAIHGGPHGMYSFGTSYMWFEWQHYASMDYLVLYTNPRGSSGYGSAFGNEIKNAYPSKDFDDLMNGVDHVIAKGYVDTQNMFVYGCSGGGVLTAWVVGHTDRFAAASSECPVTNWFSFVGTTDGAGWYRNFAKLPWEDPSEHIRRSPLMYVGNVSTPTLLMTGELDLRTPMGQTEEYYQALRFLKVPTAMIRLQDEWHGYMGKPSNLMRALAYRRSWFEKYRAEQRPVP